MPPPNRSAATGLLLLFLFATQAVAIPPNAAEGVLKLYGAGGFARVEAYQTAILIDGSRAAVTAATPALDSEPLTLVTHDGVRWEGRVAGVDRRLGIAKIVFVGAGPSASVRLRLREAADPLLPGEPVVCVSNAFGVAAGAEPLTLQSGVVMGFATPSSLALVTVRGRTPLPNDTELILLDIVTSNPGAPGGAVLDREGRLVGVVGPERRSAVTGGWVNYALPIDALGDLMSVPNLGSTDSTANATRDEPPILDTSPFGIVLTPPIDASAPPYVTHLLRGSVAEQSGLRVDDLIVAIDSRPVSLRRQALLALMSTERGRPISVEVIRGGELRAIRLHSTGKDRQ